MRKEKLTPKQDKFAWDIGNRTFDYDYQAYEAHYETSNMSANAVSVETWKLINTPKISQRIKEIRAEIKSKEEVTLDQSVSKIGQRINLDVRDYFNDDGTFKNPKDLTREQAAFLNSFEVVTTFKGNGDDIYKIEIKKVKFESWKDLLDMNMRRLGGYAKDKEGATDNLELLRDIVEGIKK